MNLENIIKNKFYHLELITGQKKIVRKLSIIYKRFKQRLQVFKQLALNMPEREFVVATEQKEENLI